MGSFKSTLQLVLSPLIIIFLSILFITGCSGSSTNSSANTFGGGSESLGNNPVLIGTLPNGSAVYSSVSSYAISNNGTSTSGAIGFVGGVPGVSYNMSFNVAAQPVGMKVHESVSKILPTIITTPSNCVIVSGSGTQGVCTLQISAENADPGTYYMNTSATPTGGTGTTNLSPLTIVVTAPAPTTQPTLIPSPIPTNTPTPSPEPPGPVAGTLSVMLNSTNIAIGTSISGTVVLSNSVAINRLPVTIVSNNTSVATVTPSSCNLSTSPNPTCTITITAVAAGSTTISAISPGYTTANSPSFTNGTLVPGTLDIGAFNTTNILSNGQGILGTANVSLNNSAFVNGLVVNLSSSDTAQVTVSPTTCILSTGSTCPITVTGTGVGSNATITASAANYTSFVSAPFNVYDQVTAVYTAPSIYGDYSQTSTVIGFSADVDPNTVTTNSFKVTVNSTGNEVLGQIIVFNPNDTFSNDSIDDKEYNIQYDANTTSDIKDTYGQPAANVSFSFVTPRKIFVTADSFSGNLKAAGGGATGVAGADSLCQADTGCHSQPDMVCKAMITATGIRQANPLVDWVLIANATYTIGGNGYVGTADSTTAVFSFPLSSPIGTTGENVWTGFTSGGTWDTSSNLCGSWDSTTGNGNIGDAFTLYNDAIGTSSPQLCNTVKQLYCVQQ